MTATELTLRASAEKHFDEISKHTAPDAGPGITRSSYGPEETAAMRYVADWAEAIGLYCTWDIAGNLHCIREGNLPEIAFGSHVDSVPNGGRYDGVAGVVAGMVALERILSEPHSHWQQLRLIVYRGEESAWFGKCYIGSLALFGKLPKEALDLTYQRAHGWSLRTCINRVGGASEAIAHGVSVLDPKTIARFFEVHIEQGPVLEDRAFPVGIVMSIAGNHRFLNATVRGAAGHSGTTPTRLRDDAVVSFSRFYEKLFNSPAVTEGSVVVTIGKVSTSPLKHAVSVIPDEVSFTLEYRSAYPTPLGLFEATVREAASRHRVELGECLKTEPVVLSHQVQGELMQAVRKTNSDVYLLMSGAGHDAAVFQAVGIPSGMLFIRNQNGSHNADEAMEMGDFMVACDALYYAITAPLPESV